MSYDLLRGLHIIAMVAWMAGLLILPRLFVYHMRATGTEMTGLFEHAEQRLLRLIMNPALMLTWILGLALIHVNSQTRGPGFLAEPWMVVKLAGVVLVTGWHGYLAAARKRLATGRNTRSERFWRISNELPFVAAVVMIVAVTTEFG
ncbi:MAG: CopD family protein [Proteobacteria bacterium]|nr:CopD family protein [Pseudomonadota bacterium]MBW3616656.1 CopD family protein [Pseudomonadota bacterium]